MGITNILVIVLRICGFAIFVYLKNVKKIIYLLGKAAKKRGGGKGPGIKENDFFLKKFCCHLKIKNISF